MWLLKRFLYRPILDGIDAREAEITARMGEAQRIGDAAEAEKAAFAKRLAVLESERSDVLDTGRAEAQDLREKMIRETRAQLAAEREVFARDRKAQAERYATALEKSGAEALLALTRRALMELADETFEERLVIHAGRQIDASRQELLEAASVAKEIVVTTRDSLSDALRSTLTDQIAERLPGVALRFASDPAQSPGLVLRIGGVRVGWTVDTYVEELAAMVEDQITEKSHKKAVNDVR
ncbi:MAG: hypothetical protein IT521_08550 [Burkholderiales bacterium]|nr:hypothetical protein [Burkholderiales bacterium]